MTNIPSNLARVPNALSTQILLDALQRTQRSILDSQIQLATGQRVNRASDDALATSLISVLDDVVERRDQWLRNLSHADAVLNNVDTALADASDLMIEAKGIASGQIGIGSDEETRRNQAAVVNSLVNELFTIANRQFQQVHLFGGEATADAPMLELLGGIQYQGQGDGLANDLGLHSPLRITLSGEDAFGALSSRVEGNFDLDPTMVGTTRLADLNGGRGLGVALGEINVDVGGTDITVDLSTVHTVRDVIDILEPAIQAIDPGFTMVMAGTGNSFAFTPSAGSPVTITDLTGGSTAADLGLAGSYAAGVTTFSNDVDPMLTEQSLVAGLPGVTAPLGTIRIANAGQSRDLDLSGATNVRDIMNAVESLNIGVRVEVADSGDRLSFINELSGGQMSIGEVGGGMTATELGVRTLATWTRLEDFNNGLGVQIRSGSVDPVTGLPDPAADLDFRIIAKDNSVIEVDLAGAETVQDVLDAINNAAGVSGTAVTADLTSDGNGIRITDATVGPDDLVVESMNGSFAISDLGIEGTTAGAILIGEDRATVAVESVFSHLMSLRDALLSNAERGITIAADKFDADISRLAEARANVGVRSRRVSDAVDREEDLRIQDMALRSQVQDLDYTEASLRFTTLQQQLQAGLLTASQVTSMSLLDFLS
ncbi:MAG: flagellin [Planctomycetota bacterium]|jgi:flagellin-like hook-associated protein FlgL